MPCAPCTSVDRLAHLIKLPLDLSGLPKKLHLGSRKDFAVTQGQIANKLLAGQIGPIFARSKFPEMAHGQAVHDMAMRRINLDRNSIRAEMFILQRLKLIPCDGTVMLNLHQAAQLVQQNTDYSCHLTPAQIQARLDRRPRQ